MAAAVTAADWIRSASAVGAHQMRNAPEKATQTFKKGAPLVNSSGYVKEATSAAVTDIIGFALHDGGNGSSDGDKTVDYLPVELNPIFMGILGAASQHALAETDRFTAYGLAKTSGYWYVDFDEGTAGQKCVTVVEIVDAIGTSSGWVKFTLNLYGNPYVD